MAARENAATFKTGTWIEAIMRIRSIRTIAGPNIYSHRPVLILHLSLDELDGRETREFAGFNERLRQLLPGIEEHYCSRAKPGGFLERLAEGTYFGHVVEHVALELTGLAGVPVFHGKTRTARQHGGYYVVVEYQAEQGTRYLLQTAVELVAALLKNEEFPLKDRVEEARRIISATEFGPSTRAIVAAAERRGIPWRRLGNDSLVQFGYGRQRKLIQAAMTGATSAVAVDIASNKHLTKCLLEEAGIPVPTGEIVISPEEAVTVWKRIGHSVVIKPMNGFQGKGVSLYLTSAAQIEAAFRLARNYSEKIIIEEQLKGRDYRVLVVNGKVIAASERIPAHIVGDGARTIAELIEVLNQDPQRGDGHDKPLTRVTVHAALLGYLEKCGLTLDSRPRQGERVFLRECANLSTGGTARDVTHQMHPRIAAMCERAAQVIGLDICGIDLILGDIGAPLRSGDGVVEVNAAPGLRMHLSPSEGIGRDVGEAIIEMLYPSHTSADTTENDRAGRIPIVSVTGTNGKTTITRMIGHILGSTGKIVGMTTTDGIHVNNQMIVKGDTTGPRSARAVLADPAVEIAVLETARGGIVRAGLGYDWSDISVISNIRFDHIGQDGIESLDDLVFIKSLVAERVRAGGTLILNADDERLAQLMEIPRINKVEKKVVYFSMHPLHVVIRRHLDSGGTAFLLNNGWMVEARGPRETRILRAADIPITFNGAANFQIANALAAVAACRAYGMESELIARALRNFHPASNNPGRAGLYEVTSGYVLVDYGHNPDAFEAVCRMAAGWRGCRVTGVIGVPGDRDDEVVRQAGRAAATGFHKLVIKEDRDLRGRRPGEIARLLLDAVREESPGLECQIVLDEAEALRTALRELQPGEVIVLFYEKLDSVLRTLQEYGAIPARSIPGQISGLKRVRGGS